VSVRALRLTCGALAKMRTPVRLTCGALEKNLLSYFKVIFNNEIIISKLVIV